MLLTDIIKRENLLCTTQKLQICQNTTQKIIFVKMLLKFNLYFFFAIIPILTQFINSNISKWPNCPCQIFFFEFQIFPNFKFFEISNFLKFQTFWNFKLFEISNFFEFQNFRIFSWQPLARTPQKNLNFKFSNFQNLIKFDFWKNLILQKKFEIRKIWNLKILKFQKIWNSKKKIWQGQFGHFERLKFLNWD